MLLKAKKKELFEKATGVISKKISYLILVENYTGREIAQIAGIPENRFSEIKNGNAERLTDEYLAALIGKGVIPLEKLKKAMGQLSADQEKYLDELAFYGDVNLKKVFLDAKAAGIDVVQVVKRAIENSHKKP